MHRPRFGMQKPARRRCLRAGFLYYIRIYLRKNAMTRSKKSPIAVITSLTLPVKAATFSLAPASCLSVSCTACTFESRAFVSSFSSEPAEVHELGHLVVRERDVVLGGDLADLRAQFAVGHVLGLVEDELELVDDLDRVIVANGLREAPPSSPAPARRRPWQSHRASCP